MEKSTTPVPLIRMVAERHAKLFDLSHYVLKRLLNHRMTGDVTAGYIGKNIERLRDPMQRITSYILSVADIRPSAQVIPLTTGPRETSIR